MQIKQAPEDFAVKELIDVRLEDGPYTYFKLKKKNWNTISAVKEIAKRLGIKEKFLNYAGIKDKHAVTEQVLSAYKVSKERLESLDIEGIEIEVLGTGKERVNTDMLKGNEFMIVVRDAGNARDVNYIPNYFDEQRFGKDGNNHLAGKAIVQKDFRKASEILGSEVKDNNYVGALSKNKRLLKLIFNSYQSYLFNLALSEYVKRKSGDDFEVNGLTFSSYHDETSLPLLHFDTELEGEVGGIFKSILEKEGISQRDFLIRQFPDLISQTQFRKAFIKVEVFRIEKQGNIHTLHFKLPKGSYATIVVKYIYG